MTMCSKLKPLEVGVNSRDLFRLSSSFPILSFLSFNHFLQASRFYDVAQGRESRARVLFVQKVYSYF